MIRNERQLGNARRRIGELEESLSEAEDKTTREALSALRSDLLSQISSYEQIKSGAVRAFGLDDLDGLGEAIIKARLARRMTQRQLAEELGVSEQMVQKDESNAYENGGIARLADILDILGYELVGTVRPKSETEPVSVVELQNGSFELVSGTFPAAVGRTFGPPVGAVEAMGAPASNSLIFEVENFGVAVFGGTIGGGGGLREFATSNLKLKETKWSKAKQ